MFRENSREIQMQNSPIDDKYLPYYRFKLYNSGSHQFDKLKILANQRPNCRVGYVAPAFTTSTSYFNFFNSKNIVSNSVFVDTAQSAIQNFVFPTNESHYIIFRRDNNKSNQVEKHGFICSEPVKVKISPMEETYLKRSEETSFESLLSFLSEFVNDNLELQEYRPNSVSIIAHYLMTQLNLLWIIHLND